MSDDGPVSWPDAFAGQAAPPPWVLELARQEGLGAALVLPLLVAGAPVGAVTIADVPGREFTDEERRLAALFATQAALTVHATTLLRAQEVRAARLATLNRLSRLVSSSLDMDEVLNAIATAAARIVGVPFASVWLVDEGAQQAVAGGVSDDRMWPGHPVRSPLDRGIIAAVVRTRRRVSVPDVFADDRMLAPDWFRRHGLGSFLGIPVTFQDSVVGVLNLHGRTAFDLDAATDEVLRSLVAQAALAIRNASLFAESDRRRQAAEALAEIARLLAETDDVDLVARRVAENLRLLLRATFAAVFQVLPSGDLRGLAGAGDVPSFLAPGAERPAGIGAVGAAVSRTGPVISEDILDDPGIRLTPELRAKIEATSYRAALALPLTVEGRVIGGVIVGAEAGHRFEPGDVELMRTFADQAAAALQKALLLDDVRARQARLEALVELTREVSRLEPMDQVLRFVAEACGRLVSAGSATVRLRADDVLTAVATWSADGDDQPLVRLAVSASLCGTVAATGAPLMVVGLADHPLLAADCRDSVRRLGYRAWLGVPLKLADRVIGTLSLRTRNEHGFSEPDQAVVMAFASQAAVIVENARLFEEAQQRRREAEVLASLAGSVTASLDLDTVLRRVADGAQELCSADVARIALSDPASEAMLIRHTTMPLHPGWATVPIVPGRSLGTLALQTGRAVRTADLAEDLRVGPEYRALAREEGMVAAATVAIRGAERFLGILFVGNLEPRPFTERDEEMLSRLAEYAALALQNADLYARQQASEERFRSLVAGVPVGLYRAAADGTLREVNPTMVEMLGYPDAAALLRVNLKDLFVDLGELARHSVERLGSETPIYSVETRWRRYDGSCIWVRIKIRLIGDDCRPGCVDGAVEDVTERRRATEALRTSEEQLLHLQKMEAVGRLAGGIAHDFNNLLTVINGRSGLVLNRLRAEDPLRRDVGLIQKTGQRAAQLTRQLLAFSHKQVLQPKVLDLNDVIDNLLSMLQRMIGEDIALRFVRAPGPARVNADPGQIEQVIVNLAVNARDAMPEGGTLALETATVEVDQAFSEQEPGLPPGRYVRLTVTDTGVGMDAAVRSRIFEPFFTTKPPGKGTGLGLSTVYGIVTQSSGHITVDSAPGQGTTFRVYLPLVAHNGPGAAAAERAGTAGGSETVLLVEDEEDVRELARDVLQMAGYRVIECSRPEKALVIAGEDGRRIDLLITDVVMPGIGGRELVQRLSRLRPGLPVLYMSGHVDDATRQAMVEPGVAFIPKPFSEADFRRRVREALEPRSAG